MYYIKTFVPFKKTPKSLSMGRIKIANQKITRRRNFLCVCVLWPIGFW